jgi:hypothetical protein
MLMMLRYLDSTIFFPEAENENYEGNPPLTKLTNGNFDENSR